MQVHACHGTARQVDVLREVLLGMLQADPTLEPRDILVMCPDIETYAPLISAAVRPRRGRRDDGHPAHRLRVQLADRSLTQTNPLLGVAAQLLDLAGSRATASRCSTWPRPSRYAAASGSPTTTSTRWPTGCASPACGGAFDQDHRDAVRAGRYPQNTWRFGLDRVLTGVAMSADSHAWLGTTLPLDDVGSNRVELAGRFAEYVDRLRPRDRPRSPAPGRSPTGWTRWRDGIDRR